MLYCNKLGLQLYLQALESASQICDLSFFGLQLFNVNSDFLVHFFCLKYKEWKRRCKVSEVQF